jgi:AcrR family transcriptional regulator
MSKQAIKPKGAARDRILDVATDLFYRQGYRATGINEVIEKSGVAKATFYNHFPSKDDLCQVSLTVVSDNELLYIDGIIASATKPLDRFMAVILSTAPWAKDTNYRGCAFMNIAAEIPDAKSPLRKAGTRLYDQIRNRVERLTGELIESNTKKYGHLDVLAVTNDYMSAFAGAVALAEIYHAIWPIENAVEAVKRLIGE